MRAAVELVEAHDQVDERRLAGAGRADDRDRLPGLGDERQVLDQRRVRLVARTTTSRTRPGRAARARSAELRRSGDLLVGVEQLEHALGRRDARLQHVRHRRDLGERLGELPRVLDERLHVAERSCAPDATRSPPTTAIAT